MHSSLILWFYPYQYGSMAIPFRLPRAQACLVSITSSKPRRAVLSCPFLFLLLSFVLRSTTCFIDDGSWQPAPVSYPERPGLLTPDAKWVSLAHIVPLRAPPGQNPIRREKFSDFSLCQLPITLSPARHPADLKKNEKTGEGGRGAGHPSPPLTALTPTRSGPRKHLSLLAITVAKNCWPQQ